MSASRLPLVAALNIAAELCELINGDPDWRIGEVPYTPTLRDVEMRFGLRPSHKVGRVLTSADAEWILDLLLRELF